MERIGVFGGTFNPVHRAHLRAARLYREQLALDRVLLVPAYIPPHKPAPDLAPAEDRVAMLRLAVEDEPQLAVEDFEIRQGGRSYTVNTLEHLHCAHPVAELCLLMGTDMFLSFRQWRDPARIAQLAQLCAVPREASEHEVLQRHAKALTEWGARCRVLDVQAMPLSSTQVRAALRCGGDVSALLHPAVLRYIREKGLYM